MGVTYDIKCKDCNETAGIGSGCSKARDEMNIALGMRDTLETWHAAGLQMSIDVGHEARIEPYFFAKHSRHRLAVIGDNGKDYTTGEGFKDETTR